jgi:nicotinate-nucleotide pyrophosphorylase (carboxylating)
MELDKARIDTIIRFALKEDIRTGDITSESIINRLFNAGAVIEARARGVVCGMNIIERIFAAVDCTLRFRPVVKDGEHIESGQPVAFIEGAAQSILKAERTALNFLSLLSGVATNTRQMVDRVKGTGVKIYDTRKTIPLHRYLQKYAVAVGGGYNHRKGLWDMVLIKDNHIRAFAMQIDSMDNKKIIQEVIRRARANVQKNIRIEIEVETLKECEWALEEKPDVIMLDNMPAEKVAKAVGLREQKALKKKVLLEVSGGITLENIADYAKTGVDIISAGALTHSIRPVDFSLEIIFRK